MRGMRLWLFRITILLVIPAIAAMVHGAMLRQPARPAAPAVGLPDRAPDRATTATLVAPPATPAAPVTKAPQHAGAFPEKGTDAAIEFHESGAGLFIDARPRAQYLAGRLPFAYSLPFSEFLSGRPAILQQIPTAAPVMIYCDGGDCDASHKVAEMLVRYGYSDISIYIDGYPAWVAAGMPIETGESSP